MAESKTARDHFDRIVSHIKRAVRFRWVAIGLICVGTIASVGVALVMPRMYQSETLILYREGIGAKALIGSEIGGDASRKFGMKMKEMATSRTRLKRIIEEFRLYPRIVDRVGYMEAVEEMRKHITFTQARESETFSLGFQGEDPDLVQKVLARLAEDLMAETSRSRVEQAGVTKEFLDAEKRRSDEELKSKEVALAQFLAKHPEFAKDPNGTQSGGAGAAVRAAQTRSKSGDPALLALEREAARIQDRLGMPVKRKEREGDPRLVAARNDAEQDLKNAQRELADKLAQFTEEHPDVRAAKSKVRAAESKMNRAVAALLADDSHPQEAEAVVDRATLESQLKKINEEISQTRARKRAGAATEKTEGANWIVELETEWTRLSREATDARERNQQLEDRQFKASIVESAVASSRNAQMVIVDPAFRPAHPNRGRTVVVGVGMAASVGLALLMALLLSLLDDRLYDRHDIDALDVVLLSVMARVPASKRGARG
jgi:uncharacterized protein involved in exopolysaccharide biosynthesis